jgi:hypothetical protein
MKLAGRRVLIAGSADPKGSEESLVYAHALVSELSRLFAGFGANFVIGFGGDPLMEDRTDGPSIIFDWTVAETVYGSLAKGVAQSSNTTGRLIITVSTEKTFRQIPANRLGLYTALRNAGALQVEALDPGWRSGAIRRQRQAQLADILIAISGGEGVEHLAQEFASRGKHVIPLDLKLGSSSLDGSGGGARLFGEALKAPDLFFEVLPRESGADLLDRIRSRDCTVPPNDVAAEVVQLIDKLVAPRVFYVRLLNTELPEFAAVEAFFRDIADPVASKLGLEPQQMGIGENDYAWINVAIFERLHHSEVALVDLTGVRPNCFMELGYALGNAQRVIVTAQAGTKIPFDSSCLEIHFWNPEDAIEKRLDSFEKHWTRNINIPPIVRPRGSI